MNEATNWLHADSVLYFSDHGEQVTERPGHNADQFDYTMVHIPFWIYTSDAYKASHPVEVKSMLERRNMPFSNDMLYDTFMGIMGLTAAHYDPTADIFSPHFDKDVTTLMTMYGNVMIRNDVEQLGSDQAFMDDQWNRQIADRARADGNRSFDWDNFHQIPISAQPMPEVENSGTSQET